MLQMWSDAEICCVFSACHNLW